MDFVVRAAEPGDEPLIASVWGTTARRLEPTCWVPREIYWEGHNATVGRRMAAGRTLVACHADDPGLVVAFLVFETRGDSLIVHWAYTAPIFRRMGVMKRIVEGVPHARVVSTSTSRHFADWLRKKSGAVYDPYF
jgi:GNAT superfamily N-acetyltransferase